MALPACDLFDPTDVDNPLVTVDDVLDAPRPTATLLPGLRGQFARTLGAVVTTTEPVTDNVSVHDSGLSFELDTPRELTSRSGILNTSGRVGAYWNLQELRAYGDLVLDEVVPSDTTATADERAEAHVWRALAYVMLGENFSAAPVQPDGAPVPARQHLDRALTDLRAARSLAADVDLVLRAEAVLARTFRALGQADSAAFYAQAALDRDAEFAFVQGFDGGITSLGNEAYEYVAGRLTQDLQPLPRLDFLDPKYTAPEAGIAYAKAEEMRLLLAETAMARGNYNAGIENLAAASALAQRRAVVSFAEQDVRLGAGGVLRPRDARIAVRADADSPLRDGLVLQRPTAPFSLPVPVLSATSISADSVRTLSAGAEVQLRRLLYTLRQEILYLEGRRMHDLGIRLPIMRREIDTNSGVSEGDAGTTVVVPAYIPEGTTMDRYTPFEDLYDGLERLQSDEVTMLVDMNRVLATERGLVVTNPQLDG
ncbi:MAG: hypothetical protein AAF809_08350 [Bacteroidota bacterium]